MCVKIVRAFHYAFTFDAQVVSTMAVHAVLYVGMNLLFLYWDRNGIFEQYKLHRTRAMVRVRVGVEVRVWVWVE